MPQGVTFSLRVESVERAREIAAQFPKSYKVRGTSVTSYADGHPRVSGYVGWSRRLNPNDVNGGANETGIAAYHRMIAKLDQLGYDVEWATPYSNSYRTREAFEASI
jgi:hypothetical protein